MLQKIRDSLQTQRWFGIAILGAIALVFVAWGAYGIVDVGFGGGNYAAKVNGEKISIDEASRAWLQQQTQWQQAFGGEIPAERRKELQAALLDALVREKLLTERTGELGYRVSEQQLDRAVAAEPAFQVDGKFSAQLAKARLAQAGLAEHTFYAELRQAWSASRSARGCRSRASSHPRRSPACSRWRTSSGSCATPCCRSRNSRAASRSPTPRSASTTTGIAASS